MDGLLLHCGAQAATLDVIERVPTPPRTATHHPIPHGLFIRGVRQQLLSAGIEIQEEAYGLSKDGARAFGTLALKAENLPTIPGSDLVLGLRNSHDKTFCAGLALGNRVFVCDNLSFVGTRTLARKHTRHVERDLPELIARILGKLGDWAAEQARRVTAYQSAGLTDEQAHDFMIRAIQAQVICASRIAYVIGAWYRDDRVRNLWGLFNAFTEALRGTMEVPELARRTERLHGMADAQVVKVLRRDPQGVFA